MTLTSEHMSTLKAPFDIADHEWLQGNAYITESAITNRIEEVDPAWQFEILSTINRESQIVVTARMTVCNVSRDGIGMASIIMKNDREMNEPEKSAATDALKRCARLFGVGRYLLDLPANVRDENGLRRFLGDTPSAPPAAPQPTAPDASIKTLGELRDAVHKALPSSGMTDDEIASIANCAEWSTSAFRAVYTSLDEALDAIKAEYQKQAQTPPPVANGKAPKQSSLIDVPEPDHTYDEPNLPF